MAWVLVLGAVLGIAAVYSGELSDTISVPGSEAEVAREQLGEHYPAFGGATAQVVFHTEDPRGLDDPRLRAAIEASLRNAAGLPNVTGVTNPAETPQQVSQDGRTAFADIFYSASVGEVGKAGYRELSTALQPAREAGLEAHAGGELAFATSGAETGGAEVVGIVVALVVLLFVFGTAVAAGLPIVMALFSVGVTTGGLLLVARFAEIATEAPQVGAMIGLGVGIDYALLVVNRHRQGLLRGDSVDDALAGAAETSGRSVLFAGATVVIAVAGLYFIGVPAVVSLASTCAVVVAVSVLATLTLVPAVLKIAGRRVLRKSEREAPASASPDAGTAQPSKVTAFWRRWAVGVERRSWTCLLLGALVLVVLSIPALSMELSMPDGRSLAAGSEGRSAYDLLDREFGPGANGPLTVLATADEPITDQAISGEIRRVLSEQEHIGQVTEALPAEDRRALVVQAIPDLAPADPRITAAIEDIRAALVSIQPPGMRIQVTGPTALFSDLSAELSAATPIVVIAVVLLSALLLLMVFRSVAIAVSAAIFNLLGIGAAFGVLVAVFQWGWGLELFGLREPQAIASFVPVILFAIVFGLSMDYEVFLMGRVREEYLRTGDAKLALRNGLSETAKIITAAALIMVSVFLGFAFAQEPLLKMLGLGLAVAVAVDATVVRMLLIPAAFAICGEKNWWIPRWLDRVVPKVDPHGIERPAAGAADSTSTTATRGSSA